jgi:transcriptional regulator of acetoin/glycerol metabolism
VPASFGTKQPRTKTRKSKLNEAAVNQAMEEVGGNKVAATKLLGVSRATLYRFLEEAGL